MSGYSPSSSYPQSVLGLDLPQYDNHESYSSIYSAGDLDFETYAANFPGYHSDALLDPMFSPKTIHPRALEGTSYDFGHPVNSMNPVDSLLKIPPQASPLLAASPISDLSDSNAFSVPSTVATTHSAPLPRVDRGDDAYFPSDNDDDDEYTPGSGRSVPHRRRATRHSTAGGRKARSATPASKPTRKTPYSTVKKGRQSPPSRVFQSQGSTAHLMQAALSRNDIAASLKFQCPEEACDYKMGNKPRMPDFRRHLRAHLRDQNRALGTAHICKGVLVAEYNELSERQQGNILRGGNETYWIGDEHRIGGCQQSFSRGDALTRHVKSLANPCAGWVSGHLEGC